MKTGESQSHPPNVLSLLLRNAIKGNRKAFREIYDMISGRMYSLCMRYTGTTNDANQAFQEGLRSFYDRLSEYNFDTSFEEWSRSIFVHICIAQVLKTEDCIFIVPNDNIAFVKSEDVPETLTMEEMHKRLRQLPASYRLIANLNLVEGYSHRDIATLFAISEEVCKQLLECATRILYKRNRQE